MPAWRTSCPHGYQSRLGNPCQNTAYNIRNATDKLSEEDKKTITEKVDETIRWIENNQSAEVDEFENKKKELEDICNPIIANTQQSNTNGPTIEEVD